MTTTEEIYLGLDTETTGLPNGSAPRHPSQARVTQLAMILMSNTGTVLSTFSSLVRPDGWKIGPEAAAITGHTDEICQKLGISSVGAFSMFLHLASKATHLVCHNTKFDWQMMNIEAMAHENPMPKHLQRICTMEMTIGACKLPPTQRMIDAGRKNQYKQPKLSEALEIICGKKLDGAHDALNDVRSAMDLFFEMRRRQAEAA